MNSLAWAFLVTATLTLLWATWEVITHRPEECPECTRRLVAARERHPSPSTYATECDEPGCYCHRIH
jgi:hypothetical protein